MNAAEDVFAIAGVYDVFMRRVEDYSYSTV